MRPTIPLGEWRIAVNLEYTQSIQNQAGMAAVGCTCEDCQYWSDVWPSVFPVELRTQLERIQISIANPSDLYLYEREANGAHYRVVYHMVGKILSGPQAWFQFEDESKGMHYHNVSDPSRRIGLVVVPSSQTFDCGPKLRDTAGGDLIQIDFRLFIPHKATASN
ncbi:MAG: hypothetical protein RLZZ537_185 [Pseudomonadota bacterium]|jgi:hypothetical protein